MSASSADFVNHLTATRQAFEQSLPGLLARTSLAEAPPDLAEAIRYSLFSGSSKRVRPVICLEAAKVAKLPQEKALLVAAALELLHTYSLIHDDLPPLDNDDMRRGQPTSHKKFGEDVAILAGDGLQALAFECLAQAQVPPEALRYFAAAVGPAGMVGGQYLDIKSAGKLHPALLQTIHRRKTGRLIEASFVLPFMQRTDSLKKQVSYGAALGKLFQIADDLLDATGNPQKMGKKTGKDGNKLTYISLYGVEQTRKILSRLAGRLQRFARLHFPEAAFFSELPWYLAERSA